MMERILNMLNRVQTRHFHTMSEFLSASGFSLLESSENSFEVCRRPYIGVVCFPSSREADSKYILLT